MEGTKCSKPRPVSNRRFHRARSPRPLQPASVNAQTAEQRYPNRTGFPTGRDLSVVLRVLRVKVFRNNGQARTTPVSYRIRTPLPVRAGEAAEKDS